VLYARRLIDDPILYYITPDGALVEPPVAVRKRIVPVQGADQHLVAVAGSNDAVINVTGNEDMPAKQDITLFLNSDQIVRTTIAGSGSIAGWTFRSKIKLSTDLAGAAIMSGVPIVSDATKREVDWTIADTDWAGITEGSGYAWDLWRDDAGSDIPLVYGQCVIQRLPGS
jgi:hypothetical protein